MVHEPLQSQLLKVAQLLSLAVLVQTQGNSNEFYTNIEKDAMNIWLNDVPFLVWGKSTHFRHFCDLSLLFHMPQLQYSPALTRHSQQACHNPICHREPVADQQLFLISETWATISSLYTSAESKIKRRALFSLLEFLHLFAQPPNHLPSSTYYQVISRFSFIVPRSLMSTATTWGRAANRSFVSQVTLPTRMWVASPLTSVTCRRQEQVI